MATVHFTKNLQRHVASPTVTVAGATLREALDAVFAAHPALESYVLDDQRALRYHVSVFIDGEQIADRTTLTDVVTASSKVYVMQALSGG